MLEAVQHTHDDPADPEDHRPDRRPAHQLSRKRLLPGGKTGRQDRVQRGLAHTGEQCRHDSHGGSNDTTRLLTALNSRHAPVSWRRVRQPVNTGMKAEPSAPPAAGSKSSGHAKRREVGVILGSSAESCADDHLPSQSVTRLKKKSTMTKDAAPAIWRVAEVAVAVMGTIISIIQDAFPGYHGVAWYWRDFTPPANPHADGRYLLRFWQVDYLADVWVNGVHVGQHEGGEDPFVLRRDRRAQAGGGQSRRRPRAQSDHEPIDGIRLTRDSAPQQGVSADPGLRLQLRRHHRCRRTVVAPHGSRRRPLRSARSRNRARFASRPISATPASEPVKGHPRSRFRRPPAAKP